MDGYPGAEALACVAGELNASAASMAAFRVFAGKVAEIAADVCAVLQRGNKVLLAGNGGSAAEVSHFAAELVGRFRQERQGLPCVALTVDPATVTAISNDYGYKALFSRQVEALGKEGDLLICFSTSGRSENLVWATAAAHRLGMESWAMLGRDGGDLVNITRKALVIPGADTARIQEAHLAAIHAICAVVDRVFTR